MPDQPVISFSIVSWNVRELLWTCLHSIEQFVSEPYEIIVVDNASTDGSAEMIAHDFPNVQLFRNNQNLGFAAANNQAFEKAKGQFVVLLNPDTELMNNPFPVILDYLRANDTCAAVGPELLNADRSHQLSIRHFPTWRDQILLLLKLRPLASRTKVWREYAVDESRSAKHPINVDQVMGACLVIPRPKLQAIGDFDEGYWIWFEEVDWCKRAHDLGYGIVFHPGAQIIHHGGQSFGQVLSIRKQAWLVKSLNRYARKYWSLPARVLLTIVSPFSLALGALQVALKPR